MCVICEEEASPGLCEYGGVRVLFQPAQAGDAGRFVQHLWGQALGYVAVGHAELRRLFCGRSLFRCRRRRAGLRNEQNENNQQTDSF